MANTAVPYDALLLLSVGGPESAPDVRPFLERLAEGKRIPRQRLEEVAERYFALGGRSPHNEAVRALVVALMESFRQRGPQLAVYWGNRYWFPTVAEAIAQMAEEGIERALAVVLSPFGSYPGCRAYMELIEKARAESGSAAPRVDKIRLFYNHPLFIQAWVDQIRQSLREVSSEYQQVPQKNVNEFRLAFAAHSLPLSYAQNAPYVAQFASTARLIADQLGIADFQLVYQSRSGSPSEAWLEPDVKTWLETVAGEGYRGPVVVAPIGFLVENLETVYDLDIDAREFAAARGLELHRVRVPGAHPAIVEMIRELVLERVDPTHPRRALGPEGPWPDACPPTCCPPAPPQPWPATD